MWSWKNIKRNINCGNSSRDPCGRGASGNYIMAKYKHTQLDSPEVMYFLTYVTRNRQPFFDNRHAMRLQWSMWKRILDKGGGCLFAFVFLGDHSHVLIKQGMNYYSDSIKMVKQHLNNKLLDFKGSIWQPKFWEHLIRDDDDLKKHTDYIHYNPVKHIYVSSPIDYPYSSFEQFVLKGVYTADWGESVDLKIAGE